MAGNEGTSRRGRRGGGRLAWRRAIPWDHLRLREKASVLVFTVAVVPYPDNPPERKCTLRAATDTESEGIMSFATRTVAPAGKITHSFVVYAGPKYRSDLEQVQPGGVDPRLGKVINVSDAYTDPRFNPSIDLQTGYRTRNLLAVPLQNLIDGEVVGAFEVLNKRHGAFDAEDEEILKSLAAQAAIAIQTARSIGELTKENAHLWHEVEGRYARRGLGACETSPFDIGGVDGAGGVS